MLFFLSLKSRSLLFGWQEEWAESSQQSALSSVSNQCRAVHSAVSKLSTKQWTIEFLFSARMGTGPWFSLWGCPKFERLKRFSGTGFRSFFCRTLFWGFLWGFYARAARKFWRYDHPNYAKSMHFNIKSNLKWSPKYPKSMCSQDVCSQYPSSSPYPAPHTQDKFTQKCGKPPLLFFRICGRVPPCSKWSDTYTDIGQRGPFSANSVSQVSVTGEFNHQ